MSKVPVRESFLTQQWRRYPALPPAYSVDNGWLRGRFDSSDEKTLRLTNPATRMALSKILITSDKGLGPSIPMDALKKGDVILCRVAAGEGGEDEVDGVFLLSPCMEEPRFSKSVIEQQEWQNFLEAVHEFFILQGFRHWKTATLVPSPGVDAHIDFFKAQGVRTQSTYSLPCSPELELKKAIMTGEDQIFEIKSVFRDDDKSAHHNPEFTMLEWYRSYTDKWVLLRDIEELMAFIALKLNWQSATQDTTAQKTQRRSLSELFKTYVGIELTPRTAKQELSQILSEKSLDQSPSDDWDDLFFRLYIEFIEPHLGKNGLEAIYNFPATQGSLSRMTNEGWADRFEVYWHGVELANAYQEQNDPFLMEVRARGEAQKRQNLGREAQKLDEEFFQIMKGGFPPCAGIALGLDRLFMVMRGQKHI